MGKNTKAAKKAAERPAEIQTTGGPALVVINTLPEPRAVDAPLVDRFLEALRSLGGPAHLETIRDTVNAGPYTFATKKTFAQARTSLVVANKIEALADGFYALVAEEHHAPEQVMPHADVVAVITIGEPASPSPSPSPSVKVKPRDALFHLLSAFEADGDTPGTVATEAEVARSMKAAVATLGEPIATSTLKQLEKSCTGEPGPLLLATRAAVAAQGWTGAASTKKTGAKRMLADRTGSFAVFGEHKDKTLPRTQMPLPTAFAKVGDKVLSRFMSADELVALANAITEGGPQVLVLTIAVKGGAA